MKIVVNGEHRTVPDGTTVAVLLDELGLPGGGRGVAVALDGEVVPRSAWSTTVLHQGERVEVVVAAQGG
jgi:sulfur carrier protein